MNTDEIRKMNSLMKTLENDAVEIREFIAKLQDISQRKKSLEKFYREEWMDYYEHSADFNEENLEILNQDSLWNALADLDAEIKGLLKQTAKMI